MAQLPVLRTRRSQAVHSRRLAVQVRVLERQQGALQAERARAVRALQHELQHLHRPPPLVPLPPLSPGFGRENGLRAGSTGNSDILRGSQGEQSNHRAKKPATHRLQVLQRGAPESSHLHQQKWPASHSNKILVPPIIDSSDSASKDESRVNKRSSSSPKLGSGPRADMKAGPGGSHTAGKQGDSESLPEQHIDLGHNQVSSSRDTSPAGVPGQSHSNPKESRALPSLNHGKSPRHVHANGHRVSQRNGPQLKDTVSEEHSNRNVETSGNVEEREPKSAKMPEVQTYDKHIASPSTANYEDKEKMSIVQNEAKRPPVSTETIQRATSNEAKESRQHDEDRKAQQVPKSHLSMGPKEARLPSETTNTRFFADGKKGGDSAPSQDAKAHVLAIGNHWDRGIKPPTPQRPASRSLDLAKGRPRHSPASGGAVHQHKCHLTLARSGRCVHFPCARPPTYHSLGFHPDKSSHPWPLWLVRNASRPHHRLRPWRGSPSARQQGASSRDTSEDEGSHDPATYQTVHGGGRLGREEVVRLDMARKKRLLRDLHRPPSWNTNYGTPTPFKRLNNALRPRPLL